MASVDQLNKKDKGAAAPEEKKCDNCLALEGIDGGSFFVCSLTFFFSFFLLRLCSPILISLLCKV